MDIELQWCYCWWRQGATDTPFHCKYDISLCHFSLTVDGLLVLSVCMHVKVWKLSGNNRAVRRFREGEGKPDSSLTSCFIISLDLIELTKSRIRQFNLKFLKILLFIGRHICLKLFIPCILHVEFSCSLLHIMSTIFAIVYISESFKFDVWTPRRWHRCAETCKSSIILHSCVKYICTSFGFVSEIICYLTSNLTLPVISVHTKVANARRLEQVRQTSQRSSGLTLYKRDILLRILFFTNLKHLTK